MFDDKLKIGTITANYNDGAYFADCLQGLLTQTVLPNYIVVVDDKSTDDSWEVINKTIQDAITVVSTVGENGKDGSSKTVYKDSYGITFICIRHAENGGPAKARNTAIREILDKAHVLCVADCDDYYYPTKIEESINVIKRFPEVGLVYSDYDTLNNDTGEKAREYKEIFAFDRLSVECIVSNCSVIRTEAIKTVGLYDESLFGPEDYDMWLRISEQFCVYHIPKALYTYRITGNNITITTPSSRFAEHVRKVHAKKEERRHAVTG